MERAVGVDLQVSRSGIPTLPRELILDAFTSRPEVAHVETSLIYEHAKNVVSGPAAAK